MQSLKILYIELKFYITMAARRNVRDTSVWERSTALSCGDRLQYLLMLEAGEFLLLLGSVLLLINAAAGASVSFVDLELN